MEKDRPKGGEPEPSGWGKPLWGAERIRPGVDGGQLLEYRRDFQIADWAGKLGIPRESLLHNETVATYVGAVRDVDALRDAPYHQVGTDDIPLGSSLDRRFDHVSHLLTSVQGILCETLERDPVTGARLDGGDQPRGPATPWNLADSISQTVSVYAPWRLVEEDETHGQAGHRDPAGLWVDPEQTVFPRDPLKGRPEPELDIVDRALWWERGTPARQQLEPEHLVRVRKEAHRLGLSAADARMPATHTALTYLLNLTDLAERTADTQSLPPAPGLDPAAPERLRRVTPLLRLGALVLEDEYRPVRGETFELELRRFAEPYHLRLERWTSY